MNRRTASLIPIALVYAQSLSVAAAGALILTFGDVAWPGLVLVGLAVANIAVHRVQARSDRATREALETLNRRIGRAETAYRIATETLAYYAQHENWIGQSITEPSPGNRARAAISRLANP